MRAEGVDPVLVLWALSREIRSLSGMAQSVRTGESIERVLNQQRVWERRKPLVRAVLKRHSLGRWYAFLQQSAKIDRIIKDAFEFAKNSPKPLPEELMNFVYAD